MYTPERMLPPVILCYDFVLDFTLLYGYQSVVNHLNSLKGHPVSKFQLVYNFENEDEIRVHLDGSTRSAAVVTAEPEVTAGADVTVDADGMPYDAEVHSESRALTAAGLWKAQRGKAAQAEAARAAFKAKGGTVAPPADLPVTAAAMPGLPTTAAAAAMPGLPVAAVSRAPVSFEAVVAKLTDLMSRGKVAATELGAIYILAGAAGPEQFETDETARAKLMDILVARDI